MLFHAFFLAIIGTALILVQNAAAASPCENPALTPTPLKGHFPGGFQFDTFIGGKFSVYVVEPVTPDGTAWEVRRFGLPKTAQDKYDGITREIAESIDGICGKGWFQNTESIFMSGPNPARSARTHAAATARRAFGQAAQEALSLDFNNDGIADDAFIQLDDSLHVILRNAAGNSISEQVYVPGPNGRQVAAGDFNGDGKPDLVVVRFGGNTATSPDKGGVVILLGNGDGTFQPPKAFPAGTHPVSIAVADFNRDGKLDLATGNQDGISVLLGSGGGTFQPPVTIHAPDALSILAADFNQDGVLDLATANSGDTGSGTVSVLLGTGDGTFRAAITTTVGSVPSYLVYSDFNNDGLPDLGVLCRDANSVALLLGRGDGSFQTPVHYGVGTYTESIGVVPLDDGTSLFFTSDGITNNTVVNITDKDGAMNGPLLHFVGARPQAIAAADLNGDGSPDVVTANQGSNDISVLLAQSAGTFAPAVSYALPAASSAVGIADVNGDGKADIITANGVLLNQGNGTFGALVAFPGGVNGTGGLAIADFNKDGKPDVALPVGAGIAVLLANGDGSFRGPVDYSSGNLPGIAIASGDFNGDGKADLAVILGAGSPNPGTLGILLGKGDGTFQQPVTSQIMGAILQGIAAGDLNSDGKQDLAVLLYAQGTGLSSAAALLGNGDGTFRPPLLAATDFAEGVSIADLNGDGRPDLVVTHCCGLSESGYLIGNGDGSFQPEAFFLSGPSSLAIAITDFNHDGRPDLAIAGMNGFSGNGAVTTLINAFPLFTTVLAAGFQPLVTAESIASVFGSKLSAGTSGAGPANTLAGATVTIRDAAGKSSVAPLFYASPGQINFELPAGVAAGRALVTIGTPTGAITGHVEVAAVAPGLFTLTPAGLIAANVLRVSGSTRTYETVFQQDGTGALSARPIDLGPSTDAVYLLLYGTGIRGAAPSSVSVSIGGAPATVLFSGSQGSFIGLDQVNVLVPRSLIGQGDVTIALVAGGISSNVAHVTIR